jgi:hypothetical protein
VREILVVILILMFLGASQIYITIAEHESWGWLGFGLLIVLLLAALIVDSRNEV